MNRPVLYLLIPFILFARDAQSQSDSLQQQINQQVWKPFMRSFASLDTDAFMSVHSKAVTRVIQDNQLIYGYDRYYEQSKQADQSARQAGRKRKLELRFIQRIAGNDRAFEIGYFKATVIQPDGSSRSFYGKFHVLLRKENGAWKILMDADAAEKTDEAVFLSGVPVE